MMCTQGHMRLPCDIYSTPTVDGVTYRYLSLFRKWIIKKKPEFIIVILNILGGMVIIDSLENPVNSMITLPT